jgi:hypothetical protein
MIHKYFLSLLIVCAFLQSCKKQEDLGYFVNEEDLLPLYFQPDSLLCTATKEVPGLGSVPWTANSFAQIHKQKGTFIFTFITYREPVYLEVREILGFAGNIPLATGTYKLGTTTLSPLGSYATATADGDVINAVWDTDPDYDNYIEVTKLDTVSKLVHGKFDIRLIKNQQGSRGTIHSDRINFKNGAFAARIIE